MKYGAFVTVDFIETVLVACLVTTLFFGGWQVPYLQSDGFHFPGGASRPISSAAVALLQVAAFGFKVFFFCWFQLLVRWTLPRFRYDQLMRLGWKMMLPLSVANIFATGFLVLLLRQSR